VTHEPPNSVDVGLSKQGRVVRLMIVGLGMMGRAVAAVAAAELPLTQLHLVDKEMAKARDVAAAVSMTGPAVSAWDSWVEAVGDVDAVILALPWSQTEQFFADTCSAELAAVSITRPPVTMPMYVPDVIRKRKGPALLPVGLEPGLAEILISHVVQDFDRVHDVELLCGGLTVDRPAGFPYRLLFGGTRLPFERRPAYTIVSGERRIGERFSDVRPASLPGLPSLESYIDGMVPWLHELAGIEGVDIQQRTVRWPGFASAVSLLREAGFLEENEIEVAGMKVSPRRISDELLGRRLQRRPNEHEVTHLQVTAHGIADGQEATRQINVWCRDDETPLMSGMACITAVVAIAATALVARLPAGWIRPEETFDRPDVEHVFTTLRRYGAHVRDHLTEGRPI
jgi:saccharopine dehydrogenase-like NADP-dependent oxidoreductase